MKVLITGGAGYIGSHTIIELIASGHRVVAIDNLINSSEVSLERVEQIVKQKVPFIKTDLCDKTALETVFKDQGFDAVIHFAGLKAVGESVAEPLRYYENNLVSTLNLLHCMKNHSVSKLIFSSSATVYGQPESVPITEEAPLHATSPYGRTKLMIEDVLRDFAAAEPAAQINILRYFNPVGAHASGLIGEDPAGIPNNLLPYVSQVAVGKLKSIKVFGSDYETPDGTGIRDYIHVVDLAKGHVAALEHLPEPNGCEAFNLGTGRGYSVLEVIKAFSKACGKDVPYELVDRRPGDIAACYADVTKAKTVLSWKADKSLEEACADSWRWQSNNPNGFRA